ncbi:hypothetical protein S7711_11308 [Stachybotrys chartarum IBT 7711]|uniref:2EXR domain-containing protein n=1 Tax=Stachybotrys chartarum (strain CBS 109288 / IBT 7711) TaxID=1280523 RepID=A0A084AJP1_STACB|nr:hypothetical protein S7711_11308 [Stachybotrys chartarum IBT 7711]
MDQVQALADLLQEVSQELRYNRTETRRSRKESRKLKKENAKLKKKNRTLEKTVDKMISNIKALDIPLRCQAQTSVGFQFPYFQRFPAEIRHMIYEEAIPSRLVFIGTKDSNHDPESKTSSLPPPPVAHVCRESRRVAQSLGKMWTIKITKTSTWFTPSKDVMLISPSNDIYGGEEILHVAQHVLVDVRNLHCILSEDWSSAIPWPKLQRVSVHIGTDYYKEQNPRTGFHPLGRTCDLDMIFKLLQGQSFALIDLDDEACVDNTVTIIRELWLGNLFSPSDTLLGNFYAALEFVQKLVEDRSELEEDPNELMWQTEVDRFMMEWVTIGWDTVLPEQPNASTKELLIKYKCNGTIPSQEELIMDPWAQERLAKMPKLAPVYALAVVKGYQLVNE